MNIHNLNAERNQKIMHLNSTKRFFDEATRLKAEMETFVRDSEQKLNNALVQVPQNKRDIAKLREQLEKDRRLYTQYQFEVKKDQEEMAKTVGEIQHLTQQIRQEESKSNASSFYQQRRDNSDNDGSTTSKHLPGGRFCSMR